MFITLNGESTPWQFFPTNPSQLYTKNHDGTLVAFNGSKLENEEYINQVTEGIRDTLNQEYLTTKDELIKSKDEVLAKMPKYVKIKLINWEIRRYKMLKNQSFWKKNSLEKKITYLQYELQTLVAAIVPDYHYYELHYTDSAIRSVVEMVERELMSSLKDVPTRDMIKATLITVPNIKSKSFSELLNMFK